MLLYLCALSAICECPILFGPALSIVHADKHKTLTKCSANVGPPSTTLRQHYLNMGQRHRPQANINPALVQIIVPVPPACRYRQHEVLIRAEWILAYTGEADPTFKRHWVGVGLYSPPAVCTARPAAQRTQAFIFRTGFSN